MSSYERSRYEEAKGRAICPMNHAMRSRFGVSIIPTASDGERVFLHRIRQDIAGDLADTRGKVVHLNQVQAAATRAGSASLAAMISVAIGCAMPVSRR